MGTEFLVSNGPACSLCGGTSWLYTFQLYGSALCGSADCNYSEGPLRFDGSGDVLPVPQTEAEAVALHERFRGAP